MLDEALEAAFPASDPFSLISEKATKEGSYASSPCFIRKPGDGCLTSGDAKSPSEPSIPDAEKKMANEHAPSTDDDTGNAVSNADCKRGWDDYCAAMSLYGRDSAEVLIAYQVWMRLKELHGLQEEAAKLGRHLPDHERSRG